MIWTVDGKKPQAWSDSGYRITWCENQHGTWFNAYAPRKPHTPDAKYCHIEASYKLDAVKAACEDHAGKQPAVAA